MTFGSYIEVWNYFLAWRAWNGDVCPFWVRVTSPRSSKKGPRWHRAELYHSAADYHFWTWQIATQFVAWLYYLKHKHQALGLNPYILTLQGYYGLYQNKGTYICTWRSCEAFQKTESLQTAEELCSVRCSLINLEMQVFVPLVFSSEQLVSTRN